MRTMDLSGVIVDGISAEAERIILRELENLGILVTCETCGQCDMAAARCITTIRGNGICGKSLCKIE
ncbi:MAG: hypothetical protein ABIQ57_03610 [Candidatus Kapaibacterium sp.]